MLVINYHILSVGFAGIRTQGNLFQFEQKPIVIVYYNVDYVKDPKGSNYWRNRVLKVAQNYKRKVQFAVSNKEEFSSEIETNGLGERKDSDKPIVAILTNEGKYPMDQEFRCVKALIYYQKIISMFFNRYLI